MKKLLLITASLVAISAAAPASAADLAARPYTKAPPMMAAIYDWSGFYIGINGGGGSAHTCWDLLFPAGGSPAQGCHDAARGTLRRQIRYPWHSAHCVFRVGSHGHWADV